MEKRGISSPAAASAIGRAQWLALLAALLGWLFDGMEMGVFSLVGRKALQDLLPRAMAAQPTPDQLEKLVGNWFGIILACFLVGAATGGVLFGWLGDRIGRVRAMTFSVLTYAVFTGLCGLAQSAPQLGFLRFIASLGMGGEWSLGVALVMEAWPNRSRAFMAGLIGAAGNVGYMLVGFISLGLIAWVQQITAWLTHIGISPQWVTALTQYQAWRLVMVVGAFPAILTFLIRIFVPESKRWEQERRNGATAHWATADLIAVFVGALGPGLIIFLWSNPNYGAPLRVAGTVAGLLIACAGFLFPVGRYLQRMTVARPQDPPDWRATLRRMLLAAGLSGVALLGTWGSMQWAPSWAGKLATDPALHAKEYTQIWAAIGAIAGTVGAALLGDWLGRRWTYCLLCLGSIASLLWLYQGQREYNSQFLAATCLAGVFSASFYGWLPLYLPELFRTQVRATGQGFGFNFGRILAAIGTLQTGALFAPKIELFGATYAGGYPFACSVMTAIYVVGLILIWFGPETRRQPLPD
ncbi:MAG TPA: MFS transporter [Pirellulales bacterium]|jgi:MFS family permease|nr:MFS transporter [Pirellulales bacterium]